MQIVAGRRSDRLLEVPARIDDLMKAIVEFQRKASIAQAALVAPGSATFSALQKFSLPSNPRASDNGKTLIKSFEIFSSILYDKDGSPGGNTTIGYGHLVHTGRLGRIPEKSELPYLNGISEMKAESMLTEDLSKMERIVSNDVRVPLTQNQFDALCSLVFTIGNQFDSSTLVKLLNVGDYNAASREFERWHFSHHHPVPGLPKRRTAETNLFNKR